MNYSVLITDQWHMNRTDIHIIDRQLQKRYVLGPGGLEWKELDEGDLVPPPTLQVPTEILLILMEALDEHGINSPTAERLRAVIDAMNLHLEDMRRLAGVLPMPETQAETKPLTKADIEEMRCERKVKAM